MLVMNPIHLQTLLTIVDEGSFEDAAYVLGISPSAVSQRIKALEKTVGRLLLRRGTPVSATEAGEVLMQAARRMALLQAETMANLKERIATIPLSVAINADSLATWFPPVLARVASWDAVTLTLRIEDESHSLNLLRRGDVLGAVTRDPPPRPRLRRHRTRNHALRIRRQPLAARQIHHRRASRLGSHASTPLRPPRRPPRRRPQNPRPKNPPRTR